MAKVPEGSAIDTWDGAGKVWFKVSTTVPVMGADKTMRWAQPPEGKGKRSWKIE